MPGAVDSMWLSGGVDTGVDAGPEGIFLSETSLEREMPERLVEWVVFGGTAFAG